jgi:excisionase family DNA binding protein
MKNELISVQAAAQVLGVSERHVRRLAQVGRVQGAKKIGRDWLIPSPPVVTPGSRVRPGKIKLSLRA